MRKSLNYLPKAYNFSSLVEDDADYEFEIPVSEDFTKLDAEFLVLDILASLNNEQRIVFLLALLKDFGYNITQEAFAKALHMTPDKFRKIWGKTRKRIRFIVSHRL